MLHMQAGLMTVSRVPLRSPSGVARACIAQFTWQLRNTLFGGSGAELSFSFVSARARRARGDGVDSGGCGRFCFGISQKKKTKGGGEINKCEEKKQTQGALMSDSMKRVLCPLPQPAVLNSSACYPESRLQARSAD